MMSKLEAERATRDDSPDTQRRLLTLGVGLFPILPLLPGCGGGPVSEAGTPVVGTADSANSAADGIATPTPRDTTPEEWRTRLTAASNVLTGACRAVDPQSTDELLEELAEDA